MREMILNKQKLILATFFHIIFLLNAKSLLAMMKIHMNEAARVHMQIVVSMTNAIANARQVRKAIIFVFVHSGLFPSVLLCFGLFLHVLVRGGLFGQFHSPRFPPVLPSSP